MNSTKLCMAIGLVAAVALATVPVAAQTDLERLNRDICAGMQQAAYDLNKEYEGVSITTMGGRITSVYATGDCAKRWFVFGFNVDGQIMFFLDRIAAARQRARAFMCQNAQKSREFAEAGWQMRVKVADPWGGVHQEIVRCQ